MKKTFLIFMVVLAVAMPVFADSAANKVLDIPTVQSFSSEKVKDADINAIVMAGVNAPSSMNGQPWHFTVVTDLEVLKDINSSMSSGRGAGAGTPPAGMPAGAGAPPSGMPSGAPGAVPGGSTAAKAGLTDAPLAIIISCKEGSEFDAGLACQNMSVEAQLLGYGTKIISSPTIALNGERQDEFKTTLGIPADQKAVAVLLIGKATSTDAEIAAGATARNPVDQAVSYVK